MSDAFFQIAPEDINIYCSISYQIPFALGMMGGNQIFRIRNYRDNSEPWCQSFSKLGCEYMDAEVPIEQCEPGKYVQTKTGHLLWGVKRCTNDEIVLQGCGNDEYLYHRNEDRDEIFSP